MPVALVMDFVGGTREQYEEVVRRMELGGRMAPGGLVHVAGSYEGGWRVIDVWEDVERFTAFRDEQIGPHTQAVGLGEPRVRMVEVDGERTGPGDRTAFVQCVTLPGLDRDSFHAADERILPGGHTPSALTFHVNGPVDGGWCVIDGWTSKEERDAFIESTVRSGMADAPLTGPPQFEDLVVEATLGSGAAARA